MCFFCFYRRRHFTRVICTKWRRQCSCHASRMSCDILHVVNLLLTLFSSLSLSRFLAFSSAKAEKNSEENSRDNKKSFISPLSQTLFDYVLQFDFVQRIVSEPSCINVEKRTTECENSLRNSRISTMQTRIDAKCQRNRHQTKTWNGIQVNEIKDKLNTWTMSFSTFLYFRQFQLNLENLILISFKLSNWCFLFVLFHGSIDAPAANIHIFVYSFCMTVVYCRLFLVTSQLIWNRSKIFLVLHSLITLSFVDSKRIQIWRTINWHRNICIFSSLIRNRLARQQIRNQQTSLQ